MNATVSVIAHSSASTSSPIASVVLEYNRFIHGELLTHRAFSRSSASSRAIPIEKMIADVKNNPAMPIYWGKHKAGMQAGEEITPEEIKEAEDIWFQARDAGISFAERLKQIGLHKQVVNRIIEPWMRMKTIITSTDWNNFYALRDHPDAQPELRDLAQKIKEAIAASEPKPKDIYQWHLPFIKEEEKILFTDRELIKFSAARCARISYTNHGCDKIDYNKDLALYNQLVINKPVHASPCEHQASPDVLLGTTVVGYTGANFDIPVKAPFYRSGYQHGNFSGWIQYRQTIPGNYVPD